jgi:hypothetical protein
MGKKTCGSCGWQSTCSSIISQYEKCDRYNVKLENKKMVSAADSIRCAQCIADNYQFSGSFDD